MLPQEVPDASLDAGVPEDEIVAGNTSHTRPENRAFYPALDGLRAVAFLMVFLTITATCLGAGPAWICSLCCQDF